MKTRSSKHSFRVPVVVEKDRDGYYAYCPSLQGCYTQGNSYEDVLDRLRDAVRLHVGDRQAAGEKIAPASQISLTEIDIAV